MGDVAVPPSTLPGVTYGSDSGSMFCIPFHGTPGWNSGTGGKKELDAERGMPFTGINSGRYFRG